MNKKTYEDKDGIDSFPHLLRAIHANADVFVTINDRLLEDRTKLESIYNIKIQTPEEFAKQQGERPKK